MKLLHLSDLHFNERWYGWACAQATRFDAVAVTGDLIEPRHRVPVPRQVEWLRDWMWRFPRPLILCSGNHDERDAQVPDQCRRWLANLQMSHVTTDEQRTTLGRWQIECVPWAAWPTAGGPDLIALMHAPPQGAATAISYPEGVDFGDFNLAENLKVGLNAPRLMLGGHVHRPRRWHGRVSQSLSFNPGRNFDPQAPRPNHIVIDLDGGTAKWTGPSTTESIRFA